MNAIRIVIVGAESMGKTTPAKRLDSFFPIPWVPEVGHDFAEAKVVNGIFDWSSQDFVDIANAQNQREDELVSRCNEVLICGSRYRCLCYSNLA